MNASQMSSSFMTGTSEISSATSISELPSGLEDGESDDDVTEVTTDSSSESSGSDNEPEVLFVASKPQMKKLETPVIGAWKNASATTMSSVRDPRTPEPHDLTKRPKSLKSQ